MSYDKKKLEEVFNNPEFQELIEDKDWDEIIKEGYFNNYKNENNLASFIIQELNYPLLEQFDEIPEFCFCNDENIQGNFIIPNNIKNIRMNAFESCTGLTSVTIPSSVTSIGAEAFYGCTGLTSITILKGVKNIGLGAFHNCNSLKDVYYGGTWEQFKKIVNPLGNDYLFGANFHQI